MAAPTYVGASLGGNWTTGTGTTTGKGGCTAGNLMIFQVFQDGWVNDGLGSNVLPTLASPTGFEDLAGNDNTFTNLAVNDTGATCSMHLYAARAVSGSLSITISHANGTDQYFRWYEFSGASAATSVAGVFEDITATASGTATAINDEAVTTSGADRLAVNFVGVNDDNAVGAFTGMTGGTWAEAEAEYATATGTDACIQLQTATMASAGTIDGGSYTMSVADPWRVIGFAILPSAVAATIDAQPGSYTFTGTAMTPLAARLFDAAPGSYTLTGTAATTIHGFVLSADPGGYTLTGTAAELLAARMVSGDPGAFAVSGFAAPTLADRLLALDPGAYTFTGFQAAPIADRVLSLDPASYALAGAAASVVAGRVLSSDPGTYVITGFDATAVSAAGGATAFEIDAQPGAYTLTGVLAATIADRVLNGDPASYVLTGTAATLIADRVLDSSPGAFVLTGAQAAVVADRFMEALPTSFTVSGQPATVIVDRVIQTDPGEYVVTGVATTLDYSGAVAVAARLRLLIDVGE